MTRGLPVSIHAAIEMLAAPAIMAVPFVLDFGTAATVVTVALGAILLGHAVGLEVPRRTRSLAGHAGLDYALATVALAAGLALAVGTGEVGAGSFLVGVGVAQVMLTAATRFSVSLRA